MATSVFAEKSQSVFTTYDVELTFDRELMAGIPGNPQLVEGWLRSAGVKAEEERHQLLLRTLAETGVEMPVDATWEQIEEASKAAALQTQTCVFKRNGDGLYLESRNVKAALKEGASIAYPSERWLVARGRLKQKAEGDAGRSKQLRNHFAERVFVEPAAILLDRADADDVHLQIGHHIGPRGLQSSLGYHEYVLGPVLSFRVLVDQDVVPADVWADVWSRVELNGIGALRSQGFGTFAVTRWERAD